MKKVIFETWDSNMARQEWRWVFFLEKCQNGTFSVSCLQELIEPEEYDEPFVVRPVGGLRRGADIYNCFQAILSETGGSILAEDVDAIADVVAELDP